MITEYSNGLEQVKDLMLVPPGMNADYVRGYMPHPKEVINEFKLDEKISRLSVEQIAISESPTLDEDLFNTPLIEVESLNLDMIAKDAGDENLKWHLQGLFAHMSGGEIKGAFSKGFLRINYPLPNGDKIDMVYDLKETQNSKDGLKLKSFLQTGNDGKVLNIKSFMPESDVRFTRLPWYKFLLDPSNLKANMGIRGNRVSIYGRYFSRNGMQQLAAPAQVFAHEVAHDWFSRKNPELSKDSVNWLAIQGLMASGDIASVILMLGYKFWMILPSLIINSGMYYLSRDINNPVGKFNHANLVDEAHAYYSQHVVADYLRRKGFYVGEGVGIEEIPERFVNNYTFLYQPLAWQGIDWLKIKTLGYDPQLNPNTVISN